VVARIRLQFSPAKSIRRSIRQKRTTKRRRRVLKRN